MNKWIMALGLALLMVIPLQQARADVASDTLDLPSYDRDDRGIGGGPAIADVKDKPGDMKKKKKKMKKKKPQVKKKKKHKKKKPGKP